MVGGDGRIQRALTWARDHRRVGALADAGVDRVLVATDGAPWALGALTLAGLLARGHRAAVHVVSVLQRWGPPSPAGSPVGALGELIAHRLARVLPQVREARATIGAAEPWRVHLVDGPVVPTLAGVAALGRFDLVITGIRPPAVWPVRSRPTAFALARRIATPVLAVPRPPDRLPACAVIADDGSHAAAAAWRAAARLVMRPGAVHALRTGERRNPRRGRGGSLFTHAAAIGAELLCFTVGSPSWKDWLSGIRERRIAHAARCGVLLAGRTARAAGDRGT